MKISSLYKLIIILLVVSCVPKSEEGAQDEETSNTEGASLASGSDSANNPQEDSLSLEDGDEERFINNLENQIDQQRERELEQTKAQLQNFLNFQKLREKAREEEVEKQRELQRVLEEQNKRFVEKTLVDNQNLIEKERLNAKIEQRKILDKIKKLEKELKDGQIQAQSQIGERTEVSDDAGNEVLLEEVKEDPIVNVSATNAEGSVEASVSSDTNEVQVGENEIVIDKASKANFFRVDDLKEPSKLKITCQDWLKENDIVISNKEQVRGLIQNVTTKVSSAPEDGKCAYISKTTINGTSFTNCELLGFSSISFQNTFENLDVLKPVASCVNSKSPELIVETNVVRDAPENLDVQNIRTIDSFEGIQGTTIKVKDLRDFDEDFEVKRESYVLGFHNKEAAEISTLKLVNVSSNDVKVLISIFEPLTLNGQELATVSVNLKQNEMKFLTSSNISELIGNKTWEGQAALKITSTNGPVKVMHLLKTEAGTSENLSVIGYTPKLGGVKGAIDVPLISLPGDKEGHSSFVRLFNPGTTTLRDIQLQLFAHGGGFLRSVLVRELLPKQSLVVSGRKIAPNKFIAGSFEEVMKQNEIESFERGFVRIISVHTQSVGKPLAALALTVNENDHVSNTTVGVKRVSSSNQGESSSFHQFLVPNIPHSTNGNGQDENLILAINNYGNKDKNLVAHMFDETGVFLKSFDLKIKPFSTKILTSRKSVLEGVESLEEFVGRPWKGGAKMVILSEDSRDDIINLNMISIINNGESESISPMNCSEFMDHGKLQTYNVAPAGSINSSEVHVSNNGTEEVKFSFRLVSANVAIDKVSAGLERLDPFSTKVYSYLDLIKLAGLDPLEAGLINFRVEILSEDVSKLSLRSLRRFNEGTLVDFTCAAQSSF
jgi:hypothetical protein